MPELWHDGANIVFDDVSVGDPLLLVHGDWSCGLEILSVHRDLAETRRLIAPDRRGYGRSTRLETQPPDHYGVHAGDLAAVLDYLQIERTDVLGFSGGGVAALRLALAQPARVRSLVLECTHFSAGLPAHSAAWFRRLVEEPERLPAATREAMIACHGEARWRDVLAMFAEASLRAFAGEGDLYGGQLGRVACPTLILHGSRDIFIRNEQAGALHAAVPGSELHIFPDGEHGLFDRSGPAIADECRRLMGEFWNRL
jgi:pimeloyl-ACP methyl ester carboxylesterase